MDDIRSISFDLSLNSTGVAMPDGSTRVVKGLGPKFSEQERLGHLFREFCAVLTEANVTRIYKEAPFLHARRFNGSITLLQVHGVLAAAVAATCGDDVVCLDVSPTALKAWATAEVFGAKDGKADKEKMMEAASILAGRTIDQNDEADAFLVRAYFRSHGG